MSNEAFMRSVLQRIATGPELSKDLPVADAQRAMGMILDQEADEVQAAIFLIALRMKRETDEEMTGVFNAIMNTVTLHTLDCDRLMVIADPFNGFTRGLPASVFMAPVLAALGWPVVMLGAVSMGPKFGLNTRCVLGADNIPTQLTVDQAIPVLQSDTPWCYLDQASAVPALSALAPLRTRIVKRPCLTTIESAVAPVRGRMHTHWVTGFVHKAYPPTYSLLAGLSGFSSATIVKGIEGGVVPSLAATSRRFAWHNDGACNELQIDPKTLGINSNERGSPLPANWADGSTIESSTRWSDDQLLHLGRITVEQGLQALNGKSGTMLDAIRLSCAMALADARSQPLVETLRDVDDVLRSGAALAMWEASRSAREVLQ